MTILVIDAQGGGIGRQLITAIKQDIPAARLSVVALGLIIWLVILLIKDPKGVVRSALFKKK